KRWSSSIPSNRVPFTTSWESGVFVTKWRGRPMATGASPFIPQDNGLRLSPGQLGNNWNGGDSVEPLVHPIPVIPTSYVFDRAPWLIYWEITRACDLACRHCRAEAISHRDPRELTLEEGKALLDSVRQFGDPPPHVVITGGGSLAPTRPAGTSQLRPAHRHQRFAVPQRDAAF